MSSIKRITNKINKQVLNDFNAHITLLGGQTFTWQQDPQDKTKYHGITQKQAIEIQYQDKTLYWQTYPKPNNEKFIKKYFAITDKYAEILKIISRDPIVRKAIREQPGIRILNQPLDLTIFSFIISANKNISAIRKSIWSLAQLFGEKVTVRDKSYYTFPKTAVIAKLSEKQLQLSKIGYRAKYLKQTAILLTTRRHIFNKNFLNSLPEAKAREHLLTLPGVGNKVADCILKFSLNRPNLIPVDVWAKRFLVDLYNLPKDWKYDQFRSWSKDHFYGFASMADQFLFEWYRTQNSGAGKS